MPWDPQLMTSAFQFQMIYFNMVGTFNDPFLVVEKQSANATMNDGNSSRGSVLTAAGPTADGEIGAKTEIRLMQFFRLKQGWRDNSITKRKFEDDIETQKVIKLQIEEANKIAEAKGQPTQKVEKIEIYDLVSPENIIGSDEEKKNEEGDVRLQEMRIYNTFLKIHPLLEENHSYYIEQRFEFQGFRDLYAYAAMHGPFMLLEIGAIAS